MNPEQLIQEQLKKIDERRYWKIAVNAASLSIGEFPDSDGCTVITVNEQYDDHGFDGKEILIVRDLGGMFSEQADIFVSWGPGGVKDRPFVAARSARFERLSPKVKFINSERTLNLPPNYSLSKKLSIRKAGDLVGEARELQDDYLALSAANLRS